MSWSWKFLKSRTVWGGFMAMLAPLLQQPDLAMGDWIGFGAKILMLVGAREAVRDIGND